MIPLATPDLSGNEGRYLQECVDTGYVTHAGRFEGEFERAFSERFGLPAIATSSGTGALHLALLSLGVGPGDEVIVPDLTFGATAAVVLAVGARPVIVDINPDTWGMDYAQAKAAITRRTKAIIPVHLYGLDAGDFTGLGVPVIEDACEALGMVPVRGQMAAYSFYGNKPLTTGEGGMLVGDFGQARLWRDGGFDDAYRNALPGLNYRMSNLQAAVGLAQLERFDQMLAQRLKNAAFYGANLSGRGWWLFVHLTADPGQLARELAENGVQTRPVFTPLHRSPAFARYAAREYHCSDAVWSRGIALPTGPHMDEEKMRYVVKTIRSDDGDFDLCRAANSGLELAKTQ